MRFFKRKRVAAKKVVSPDKGIPPEARGGTRTRRSAREAASTIAPDARGRSATPVVTHVQAKAMAKFSAARQLAEDYNIEELEFALELARTRAAEKA